MAWTWSRKSKTQNETKAQHAAPPADPSAYVVPSPKGRAAPYVAANFDYADNPQSENYDMATGGRRRWRNRKMSQGGKTFVAPPGTYPAAGHDPDQWHGYRQSNWQSSERNEHLINGDEGHPPFGYRRYQSALNPYWFRIPDQRPVRTAHEWDFRRPFDQQNKLGARVLNGTHYSAANIGLTANPSESLKGMTAQRHRRTTHRIEPVEWGEDRPGSNSGNGPGYHYNGNSALGGSYAIS